MNETSTILELEIPEQRPCTRCDGTQHLVGVHAGMGKYRCDTCELVVGFDLESEPVEFLLQRGVASRYTKQWFGPTLSAREQRLTTGSLTS